MTTMGAIRAVWLLMLCSVLMLGTATATALAQSFETAAPDQPVALVADTITYDSETGVVVAEGSVEVYYGQRTLTADRITYDERTGRIRATGELVLRDPTGATVFADAADLDAELTDGLVQGARSLLDQNTKLAAVEARRIDGRYNTLDKAVYSPCKVCEENPTPLWRIRADRVIHDEQERVIHYENAWFDFYGMPIGWLPYFRHPDPSVDRASGFLFPSFVSSSILGYGLKVPYYAVIDGSSDLTITPTFTTGQEVEGSGVLLEGEYRRAFDTGSVRVFGSITDDDFTGDRSFNGHLDSEGDFVFGDSINWGWDVTFTSEDAYLNRYGFNYPNRLSSEVFLRRYRADSYFDVAGVYFQSLRSNEFVGEIPVGAPVFDARYEFQDDVMGGDLAVFTSGHSLFRKSGRDTSRLSFGADWEREVLLSNGVALKGFAELRGDLFSVQNDPAIDNDFTARASGHVGVEARWPWIHRQQDGATHIVEPIAQVIAAPYGGNGANIPVEDSLVTEFDETNVISRNHLSGQDVVEDGPRLNLMVRYDGDLSDMLEIGASVGRVFRLEDAEVFSSGSGLRNAASDYVTAWHLEWTPYAAVSHRMRFDEDFEITRNEAAVSFSIDPVQFGAVYTFLAEDPEINAALDREEIVGFASWKIDDAWAVTGSIGRNLEEDEFVSANGTLSFSNECCKVELFLTRSFTSSESFLASTSGGVRVELFSLGTVDD